MKCLECKWNDSNAPRQGKCCGECGLCALCEEFTLYKKTTSLNKGNQMPCDSKHDCNGEIRQCQINRKNHKCYHKNGVYVW